MEYLQFPPNATERPAAFLRDVLRGEFYAHYGFRREFPHVKPMWSFLRKMPRVDVMLVRYT